jgi:hypothetical protein
MQYSVATGAIEGKNTRAFWRFGLPVMLIDDNVPSCCRPFPPVSWRIARSGAVEAFVPRSDGQFLAEQLTGTQPRWLAHSQAGRSVSSICDSSQMPGQLSRQCDFGVLARPRFADRICGILLT